MSPKSAILAVKLGPKNPLVYVDGMPAWKKSGNRVIPSVDHIADGNTVLVDLRSAASAREGHHG